MALDVDLDEAAGLQFQIVQARRGDLDELARWVDSQDVADADPLQLAAAIAEVRRDPACRKCRARLRGALWPLVTRPPAAASERSSAGESGDAYLDALQREGRQ